MRTVFFPVSLEVIDLYRSPSPTGSNLTWRKVASHSHSLISRFAEHSVLVPHWCSDKYKISHLVSKMAARLRFRNISTILYYSDVLLDNLY